MSFFKKFFGGSAPTSEPLAAAMIEHKGFSIRAAPYQEQGQWQLCGEIEKEIGGEVKRHRFVRADRFATRDDAAEAAIGKARLMIDQLGDGLFR